MAATCPPRDSPSRSSASCRPWSSRISACRCAVCTASTPPVTPSPCSARPSACAGRACVWPWTTLRPRAGREAVMDDRPLRIAGPKGSLYPESVELLGMAGLDVSGLADPGRQLRISAGDVEYIIVRPSDAPIFVAYGGADCGLCGKDSVQEAGLPVVEMVDLGFGACRFVVAEPECSCYSAQESYRNLGVLRVATKYPNITKDYYDSKGMQVEIVKLAGNIELAPLIGMADVIVDITATGTTLRENHLEIVDDVMESTARFVANPASLRVDPRVGELAESLAAAALKRGRSAPIAGSDQPGIK
ncbi:MAG: ATP phosphoribosyltransferase [Coriobacteriales bacterium]|nr:ATP phosphoribosyltransferase [Coriobacteriales bacterium]